MASVNRVILVGNAGRDAEVRYAPDGTCICNVNLATTDQWKDKAGEKQERTEWHRCIAYGKPGENLSKYTKKGQQLFIEGSIRTRKYTGNDNIERPITEIIVSSFQFLGQKQDGGQRQEAPQRSQNRRPPSASNGQDDYDDLPF